MSINEQVDRIIASKKSPNEFSIFSSTGGIYIIPNCKTFLSGGVVFQGMNTGCGLAMMAQWTGDIEYLDTDEMRKIFIELIDRVCQYHKFSAIIATLGDNILKRKDGPRYLKFIEDIGFKEVDEFVNSLRHSSDHKQKIFVKKFKQ